jgi:hypothetical protein
VASAIQIVLFFCWLALHVLAQQTAYLFWRHLLLPLMQEDKVQLFRQLASFSHELI